MNDNEAKAPADNTLPVRELLDAGAEYLQLSVLAGASGLDRRITLQRIQKPGLAMTGCVDFIHPGRVQVLGSSELDYLARLDQAERHRLLDLICSKPLTCIAVTKGLEVPKELTRLCEDREIPLLRSPLLSSTFIDRLNHFLDAHLAPRTLVHGVLVDVLGVGVLLLGPSGIGKSECALDLVIRGHRLVSDDMVELRCRQGEFLVGRGPELIRHHMELRGLGIINIAHMFGVGSTRQRKRVELVVELVDWTESLDVDRLGLEMETYTILGVDLALVRLPVASGRSLSNLVEVAARNLLLRLKGLHPARDLEERLQAAMREPQFTTGAYDLDEGDLE